MALHRTHFVGLGLFFFAACACTESGPVSQPVDNSGQTESNSGQTGSIGVAECTVDTDCLPNLQERLTQFENPAGYWPKADSGVCSHWGISDGTNDVQGLACECYDAGSDAGSADATMLVGPGGLSCSNYGRRLDCLYRGSEFPGCDPADAASCSAVCVDVAARYAENARVTWETEVRLARCDNLHCYSVYRIGDNCYAQTPNTSEALATVYDCNLSSEAILAQARK